LSTKKLEIFNSEPELALAIKGVVATKQYGYEDFLSSLIAKACVLVSIAKNTNKKKRERNVP
jgi:hypothetical protein